MRRALTLIEALVILGVLAIGAAFFTPTICRSGGSARRASCQSSLKQIGLALQQYAQDYDDRLPLRTWVAPVAVYARTDAIFQCAETNAASGTSDYFFNARFQNKPLTRIKSPATLVLSGDGQNDAPLDATLYQLPAAWRKDENSPSWRHLGMANYLFADGHVKHLKVNHVTRYFRVVLR